MTKKTFVGIASRLGRHTFLFTAVLLISLSAACSSSPTAPTPPPPPPAPPPVIPDPPSLTCPADMTASTTSPTGMTFTFATPEASAGQTPVTVACVPESGTNFALGATRVDCTATDAINRSATCAFTVTVSRTPQLTFTKFLAFGDSITAGEVSFPVTTGIFPQSGRAPSFRMRVIPQASYPSVLRDLMAARYTAQASSLVMLNYGQPGEKARNPEAVTRFANAVANNRPEVVMLMHGYNDISDGGVISAAVNAVDAMAAEARNRRVSKVFMLGLVPSRGGGGNAIPLSSIQAFNERLQRAASGEGAVYVDLYSAMIANVNTYIGADGLHPNEAGYRKIAEIVLAAVQANLEVR
jgi:lysophospholipase L1-like esterase